jgi:diguanylate cyclase (GGDEF)-like protein/PAS domain S-box-containing protein
LIDLIYNSEILLRLAVIAAGFAVLSSWEFLAPKRVASIGIKERWRVNTIFLLINAVILRLALPIAAISGAYLADQNHWGLLNHYLLPLWLEIIVAFILLDLAMYLQHVMLHVLPILWRFHRVHHSDMEMDVTTGFRFHPVEIVYTLVVKSTLVVLIGAPVIVVIVFELILSLAILFTHSNVYINSVLERTLRKLYVTPDMHRIHHSVRENETNSNFGFIFSFWDKLLGTYQQDSTDSVNAMVIGLDQFREPACQKLTGQLLLPFSDDIEGYTVNHRDSVHEDELVALRKLTHTHELKATLAQELVSYLDAIGQHALVSATDTHGRIILVNDKFCQVSGYSRQELLGENHRKVNSGVHPTAFFQNMWKTISSGQNWHGQICNRGKDGSLYWVDSTIVPIIDKDGRIQKYISVRIDITEQKRRQQELENANHELELVNRKLDQLSRIDALTNIANRRYFDEMMAVELSRTQRQQNPLSLLFCDIDYFKKYNDLYGHQAGDVCLQEIAKCIQASFSRTGDVVARYGGEEFAVILPNVNQAHAIDLAESLRLRIRGLALPHKDSPVSDFVTLSIGVTSAVPASDDTAALYIQASDIALYKAKAEGRDNVQFQALKERLTNA